MRLVKSAGTPSVSKQGLTPDEINDLVDNSFQFDMNGCLTASENLVNQGICTAYLFYIPVTKKFNSITFYGTYAYTDLCENKVAFYHVDSPTLARRVGYSNLFGYSSVVSHIRALTCPFPESVTLQSGYNYLAWHSITRTAGRAPYFCQLGTIWNGGVNNYLFNGLTRRASLTLSSGAPPLSFDPSVSSTGGGALPIMLFN